MKKLLVFIIGLLYTKCNLWDNIFSQLQSPQYQIPDEFILNVEVNQNTSFKIYFSASLNAIRLSAIGKRTSSMMPSGDVYIKFNDQKIFINNEKECRFKKLDYLQYLTAKFFIVSYDLITFYKETDKYHEYSFNSYKENANLRGNDQKFLVKLLLKELDIDSSIIFKVSKETETLQHIDLNYKFFKFENMKVTTEVKEALEEKDFEIGKECKEANTTKSVGELVKDSLLFGK